MRWVRTAIRFGSANAPFLKKHSRHLVALRADPEFRDLLDDVKVRWERLVAWKAMHGLLDGHARMS